MSSTATRQLLRALLLLAGVLMTASQGHAAWRADGVALCQDDSRQGFPVLASDGAKGAIAVWLGGSVAGGAYGIYAQRVDSAGVLQWDPAGLPVHLSTTASSISGNLATAADGSGGVILVWAESRTAGYIPQLYAQRLDLEGTPLWGPIRVTGVQYSDYASQVHVVAYGNGGAVIAWWRSDPTPGGVMVQHVDSNGVVTFGNNGTTLSPAIEFRLQMIEEVLKQRREERRE